MLCIIRARNLMAAKCFAPWASHTSRNSQSAPETSVMVHVGMQIIVAGSPVAATGMGSAVASSSRTSSSRISSFV